MITASQIPAPRARFKPRADAGVLSELLQEIWRTVENRLTTQREAAGVGEIVASHLESQFPADHMATLARYGAAKEIDCISVRIYNAETQRWDNTVNVDLPRSVRTPGHHGATEVSACGPRWSREPGRGLTDAGRRSLAGHGETWESFCADQDRREAGQLPESVEPYFTAVIAARRAYKSEYRKCTNWPADQKALFGEWPTWAEIEAAFPTLGAHVASARSSLIAQKESA